MFARVQNCGAIKLSTDLIKIEQPLRGFCTCLPLHKRDKYSLKNIGSNRPQSSGRRKAPDHKKYGGSKEFPVTLFQLPKLHQEIELGKESRHKSMIENALQGSIESLIFSGEFSDILATCPIEVTRVELTSNFSSAAVYWRLDSTPGGPTEEDVTKALDQNLEFIRNMLPAYHAMTHTPLVTFIKDLKVQRVTEIDQILRSLEMKSPEGD